MEYIRVFESAADAEQQLAQITHPTLSAVRGGGFIGLRPGAAPAPIVDYTIPFYIEDVSGSENTVQITKSNSSAPTLTIEKSTDGSTWESMGTTSTTAITATIPANGRLYLRCNTNNWSCIISDVIHYNSINTTDACNVRGNIMSLLYGYSFDGQTEFPDNVEAYAFGWLFKDNLCLIRSSNLLLPATTLTDSCYRGMFSGCTSLTDSPMLPATTLNVRCYCEMFRGCTGLITAPALPVTTLDVGCYSNMFNGCTSLPVAPELPATTLTQNCYNSMFYQCSSLTVAPELPATTLVRNCYYTMFYGCRNLSYIKCLSTGGGGAYGVTNNWVDGVAANGTFVKNPNMSSWSTGASGIPSGWTVEDAV